jgi:DNA polymerase-3 subunit delta'
MPCGTCPACRWFEQGNHPDFRIVEPEALSETAAEPEGREGKAAPSRQIRIEQVRDLQAFLSVGTHRGGVRAIVVRPAEAMNTATANALLKSLEEPPPATVFILVSSAADRLLPTVRSRCQRIQVAPALPASAGAWLSSQGVRNPAGALAHAANAPLAVLEETADEARVRGNLIGALAAGPGDPYALVDTCQALPPATVIGWLQKWVHDLALAKSGAPPRFHPAEEAAVRTAAAPMAVAPLLTFERSLRAARAVAQHPLNARLFLEELFQRYVRLAESRR